MGNSGAAFLVAGTDPSTGGYDATSGQVVNLQLKASPALDITSCIYSVVSSSPNAPAPVLSNGGVATPPTAVVTMTMPTVLPSAAHTYEVQCQTNNGAAVYGPTGKLDDFSVNTKTRVVAIRNALGLRKMFVGESVEYEPNGWVRIIDDLVDKVGLGLAGASLSLGSQTPPQYQLEVGANVPTTDSSTVNLLASPVSVPSGTSVTILFTAKARISSAAYMADLVIQGVQITFDNVAGTMGQTSSGAGTVFGSAQPWADLGSTATVNITGAANDGSGHVKVATAPGDFAAGNIVWIAGATTSGGLVLNGAWVVDSAPDSTHIVLRGSTWTGAWVSGGTVKLSGCIGGAISGTTVQLQATGIVAPAWMQGESVHYGDVRATASGAYLCVNAGTTLGSGSGPTGTGTGINDNGVTWDYLGAGPGVPIVWAVSKVEVLTT